MKKLLTGICILATAGVITACGNGGSGQDTTTTPPQSTEAPTTTAAEPAGPDAATPEAEEEDLTESAGKESGEEESEDAAVLKEAETKDSVKAAVDADDTALKEAPAEAVKTVSGEVKAVGMSSVTIVTESGEEISILKDEAEVDTADGLKEGSLVTVTYTEGEEGKIATFITDAIEP